MFRYDMMMYFASWLWNQPLRVRSTRGQITRH